LVTGAPGVGYNTIGSLLKGMAIEEFGYRSTHLKPEEWMISYDVLKYRITNPELTNPYCYGFGQNYLRLATLPWKVVILLTVPPAELERRVLAFRKSHHITDSDSAAVARALDCQKNMLFQLTKACVIENMESPDKVAQLVRDAYVRGSPEQSRVPLKAEENGQLLKTQAK
jgi:hypothetical protein